MKSAVFTNESGAVDYILRRALYIKYAREDGNTAQEAILTGMLQRFIPVWDGLYIGVFQESSKILLKLMYHFWYNNVIPKDYRVTGQPTKILDVLFYSESNGNEPVRKWLKSQTKEVRSIIGKDICTVQEGWPLGMPLVRSLGSKLWEVRSTIPNGIARVIFVMKDNQMVLLHGFIKKKDETPIKDKELALSRSKNII